MHFIFTHYISNEKESVSLSDDMNNYIIKVSPEKWELKSLFLSFIFLTDFCLRFFIYALVFILCKKTGNFWSFF